MDEIDLFREFRDGVAAPGADARRHAAERLAAVIAAPPRRPTVRIVVLAAAIVAAASAALFVSAPWHASSPGFLARAEAALTPPEGSVLHVKWQLTTTSSNPACTVTRAPSEVWIDESPPHAFRGVFSDFPLSAGDDTRALACSAASPEEVGGEFDTHQALRFVPPNTLTPLPGEISVAIDPVEDLRIALATGLAHDEGATRVDGRNVERIRIDPPPVCPVAACPDGPAYAYVDPTTYYPVLVVGQAFIAPPGGAVTWLRAVLRFSTFEYLPRTPANLGLADIRAQHPDATVKRP